MTDEESERFGILAVPGSLRKHSYNRGLARAAQECTPDGVTVAIAEIGDIPLYNADLDNDTDRPEAVTRFKEQIAAADALLLVTPEYNYSVPGTLKNAIDWASRPPAHTPLRHKPVGIVGAAGGGFGTVRAQLAWRQVFVFTDSPVMLKPELFVSRAAQHFDEEGNLTDDDLREQLQGYLEALVHWAHRLRV
jgi:chromate reductase